MGQNYFRSDAFLPLPQSIKRKTDPNAQRTPQSLRCDRQRQALGTTGAVFIRDKKPICAVNDSTARNNSRGSIGLVM